MWNWLISPAGSASLGLVGLALGILGFGLTVWGLRLTYLQAKDAKRSADQATTAADAAKDAVQSFRFKLDRYSAYRDISEAEFAMDACKRHLEAESWRHASDSYDLARKAMIRVQHASLGLSEGMMDQIRQISEHTTSFCNKVDAALAGKGAFPNAVKVASTIRSNYETLSAIKIILEKDIG
ncbi:hypothetical protein [Sphingomonas sp. OTU376]|uniref:hypothetical protein n=1 Tax=Sphingomonas sp. OTU376 TaxID=3043863 RepID=UPI00313DD73B